MRDKVELLRTDDVLFHKDNTLFRVNGKIINKVISWSVHEHFNLNHARNVHNNYGNPSLLRLQVRMGANKKQIKDMFQGIALDYFNIECLVPREGSAHDSIEVDVTSESSNNQPSRFVESIGISLDEIDFEIVHTPLSEKKDFIEESV